MWAKSTVFLALSNSKDPVGLLVEDIFKGVGYVLAYMPEYRKSLFLANELDESIAYLESSVKNILASLFFKKRNDYKYFIGDLFLWAGFIIPTSWWIVIPWMIGTTYLRFGEHFTLRLDEEIPKIFNLFLICFFKNEISLAVKPAIDFLMVFTSLFISKNKLGELFFEKFYNSFIDSSSAERERLIKCLFFWYSYYTEYSSYQLHMDLVFDKQKTEIKTPTKKKPKHLISSFAQASRRVEVASSMSATAAPVVLDLPERLNMSFREQHEEADIISEWMSSFRKSEQLFQPRHEQVPQASAAEVQTPINVEIEAGNVYLFVFMDKGSKACFKITQPKLEEVSHFCVAITEFYKKYMSGEYNRFVRADGDFNGFKRFARGDGAELYELKVGEYRIEYFSHEVPRNFIEDGRLISVPVYGYTKHYKKR